MRSAHAQSGFTLTEILVAMMVASFSLAGTVALYKIANHGTRTARSAEAALTYAEALMEETRGMTVEEVEAEAAGPPPAPITVNGVTYTRLITTAPAYTSPNLVLVTVRISYRAENSTDVAEPSKVFELQLIRSRAEDM